MHRSRAPSIAPGTFFVAQPWADCITNMPGFSLRQAQLPFVDVCPDRPRSPRCREIHSWLAEHPRVTRYVVIDDEDDELDDLPLFQPSPKTGLTSEISKGVEKHLNGDTDETIRDNAVIRMGQNIRSLFKRNKS
jgi:HAD domain in Swiss Army Knife RNA repair proteins